MSFLRYLMLLSLVVWIGGLIFFAFVLAPTAFQVLPNTHLAGNLVGRALGKLHWIGIISGLVFLASSLLYNRFTDGTPHVFAMRHVLICLMLALALISQFWIIPRMDTLRASVGDFASVAVNNPAVVPAGLASFTHFFPALTCGANECRRFATGICGTAVGVQLVPFPT